MSEMYKNYLIYNNTLGKKFTLPPQVDLKPHYIVLF